MKKDKLNIDMPDEISIQNQINFIIEKGIKKEESFYSYMKNMYKQLGIKYLFHDLGEIVFVIVLISTLLILAAINKDFWINDANTLSGSLYVFIMIVSPILYLIVSLLAFVRSKEKKTYEIEMTCKYNLYELAAFRMFVFSIVGILSNMLLIGTISSIYNEIDFFRGLMISITSLFLFSTVFLYMVITMRSKIAKYIVITGWMVINFALSVFNIDFYIKLLISIPIPIYLIVTTGCIYIYLKKLKKLINFASMKGVI